MLGLIYINILKEINHKFDQPLLRAIEKLSFLEAFELDNFSDMMLVRYASEFMSNYDTCIMVLDIEDGAEKLNVSSLFNDLLKKKQVFIYQRGEHEILSKILSRFDMVKSFKSDEELMQELLLLG